MMRRLLLPILFLNLAACGGPNTSSSSDAGLGTQDAATGEDGGPVDAGADGGSTFALPEVAAACPVFTVGTAHDIDAMGVPDVAMAVLGEEIGIAFVDRQADGTWLARFARVDGAGAALGATVDLLPLGSTLPVGVAAAADGARYVVCAGSMDVGTRCFHAPSSGGTFAAGATISGASRPALAFGAGGFVVAFQTGSGISAQALDQSAGLRGEPHPLASGTGRPSIAPTDGGYVVGYASSGAFAQELDASATLAGDPIALGPSRAQTDVAITFANGAVGASWIAPSGDAIARVEGHDAATIGAGASSYGRVAVASASNGIVASWSDFAGFVGVATLDSSGALQGAPTMVDASWNDNAHALASTPTGFVAAVTTNPSGAPIRVRALRCAP